MRSRGGFGWSGRVARIVGLAALVAASAVCSDGSSPRIGGGPYAGTLRASELLEGALRTGDTLRYVFRSTDARPFVVVLTARTDSMRLSVQDSTGIPLVAQVLAAATTTSQATASSSDIIPPHPATYRMEVTGRGAFGLRVLTTTPELASSRLVINDTIRESLDATGDVDVFTFEARPGELYIGYLQLLGADTATASMELGGREMSAAVTSQGGDTELETQASQAFGTFVFDSVRVVIRGAYVGPYRFMVRRIDRRPETLGTQAIENDTIVGERLDYVGDVDEFLITGAPRALYNVMLQLTNGQASQSARVEVSNVDAFEYFASATSTGTGQSLLERSTGRFALDGSGTATVAVRSLGTTRGAYRLLVYRIDTLPELAAPVLVPTDSVAIETLDLPGDVDDYTIDLATDDTLRFVVDFEATARPGLPTWPGVVVTLLDRFGESIGPSGTNSWETFTTGALPLVAGRYRLRIATLGEPLAIPVGAYTVAAYRISSAPEVGARVIAIGDTITGAIDPAGDVDEYRFQAQKGDHIDLEMQVPVGSGALSVDLIRARGRAGVSFTDAGPTLSEPGIYRITLEESGAYLARARSSEDGRVVGQRGPYRLLVRRILGTPEHHTAELVPGDIVQDEGIEIPGDVDEYFVQGAPGGEFSVEFSTGNDPYGLDLQLVDAHTKDVVRYLSHGNDLLLSFGRLVFPESGRVMLRVQERGGRPQFGRSFPYRIVTHPIHRTPETLPVSFAIGDTVSGEAIFPVEDIDEFEFSGVAGQRLQALVTTQVGSAPGLAFQVFEPATGRLVAAARVDHTQWELGPDRSQVFTLPSTGVYLVRVQWPVSQVGDYRFVIIEP
ncbi:MAG: hypothetical protein IT360_19050 [Gemmatimonadaceae bacterium]|nr:hypothetical protein [Gemmatimonadaceae bacterium]